MKKILFILFLLASSFQATAQFAVKLLRFCPYGDQAVVFDKKFTGELMYMADLENSEDNFRGRIGISYVPLEARLDTFPSYAVHVSGNGTEVLPGYEIYKKYTFMFLFVGVDWAYLNKEKFAIYSGADAIMGGIDMIYESHYENWVSESFSGGQLLGGLRIRQGVDYKITKHIRAGAELTWSLYGVEETGFLNHYDYGLTVQYIF